MVNAEQSKSDALAQKSIPFLIDNSVVTPACIATFNRFIGVTSRFITEIYYNSCRQNIHLGMEHIKPPKNIGDWVQQDYPKWAGGGFYAYRLIGITKNKLYVVETVNQSSRQKLPFSAILLIRITKRDAYARGFNYFSPEKKLFSLWFKSYGAGKALMVVLNPSTLSITI